jgi:predicted transcriptional regulator
MAKSKAGRERLTAAERKAKAVEMRKLGFTYQKIGDELGVTLSAAHKMVTTALQELNEKAAEGAAEVRRLELERLDEWLVRVAKVVQSGDTLSAIDRGLKIQARRAKLLGLDAPTRFELSKVATDLSKVLFEAAQAGDPGAAAAVRQIADGKEDILPAWVRWWNSARLPLACTPDDIARMTAEELALAAQGQLKPYQLEEIRARSVDDEDVDRTEN